MPVVVEVKSEADYQQWVADQKAMKLAMAGEALKEFSMKELVAKGEGVYNTACAGCHQPNGQGIPGAFPAITGSTIATGAIDTHVDIIVNGKSGTAMQAFKEQLSAVDIAAVVTYQRNALGNSVGDLVQPNTIKN